MGTATHLAALEDVRESCEMLREAILGLPAQALDWTPAAGTNSIAVLARHALPSTTFWVASGCGRQPSHREYVETERRPAFQAKGQSVESLVALIDGCLKEVESLTRAGSEEHLRASVTLDDTGETWTGAGCLVHAASHLREHVGQVQLTRDLWFSWAAEATRGPL